MLAGKASALLHFKRKEAEHFQYIGASNDLQTETDHAIPRAAI